MIDVREVIAEAIPCNIVYGRPQAAGDIIRAFTSAGFRILGPDEIDGPTVEKCAEVAETCPDTPFAVSRKWHGDLRQSIPAAIRALAKEKQG